MTFNHKGFFVPGAGLEPAQPQWPLDFKSSVSTNSTIRADVKSFLFGGANIVFFWYSLSIDHYIFKYCIYFKQSKKFFCKSFVSG